MGRSIKREHVSEKTGKKVYSFDTSKRKGTYFSTPNSAIRRLTRSVDFEGFGMLPKGFSTHGYGFATPAGTFLTQALLEAFGENIKLTIVKDGQSSARKYKGQLKLTINHGDYLRILDTLREIRREKNIKSNGHVLNVLGELFPRYCGESESVETIYSYEDDKITKILGDDAVLNELSKADIDTIANAYHTLVEVNEIEFRSIGLAKESKDRNERIYLESVIGEFESRLSNTRLSEGDWQRFLQQYILLFNTSYVSAVEKLSVDLRGKYPDFILVNVFGYLDIYEIKKPSTNLLKHDGSRDNYYWDSEVSKAITQTEKYVQMLMKKALDVREIIKEKYALDVKVVRPRGYIIAGSSAQLENQKMEDDFRLLAGALKNVDVVLYDELLNNLKNLLDRLS